MKIATKLRLAAFVPALIALVVGLALALSYGSMEDARGKGATAQRVISGVNDLDDLVHTYVIYHEERPRLQFVRERRAIEKLIGGIRFKNSEQQRLLDSIGRNVRSMGRSFQRLVDTCEHGTSARKPVLLSEAEERLAGQILARSRRVWSDALRLDSMIDDEIRNAQQRVNALVFVLIAVTTFPLTVLLIRMMKKTTASLAALHRGTEVIAAGDLDHRIGLETRDEFGELARAFDLMTERLEETTVSRDALRREVEDRKRAQEALWEAENHRIEFYRRLILAATDGKLVITDKDEFARLDCSPMREWSVRNVPELSAMRDEVKSLLQTEGFQTTRLYAFIGAVVEATANAIKHANGGTARLCQHDGALLFLISDAGPGIEALTLPNVALVRGFSTAGTLGMGYKLMINLADKVYLATDSAGTNVAIEMTTQQRSEGEASLSRIAQTHGAGERP